MESTLFLKKYPKLFHKNTFRHEYNTKCRNDLRINASCLNVTLEIKFANALSFEEKTDIVFVNFKSL